MRYVGSNQHDHEADQVRREQQRYEVRLRLASKRELLKIIRDLADEAGGVIIVEPIERWQRNEIIEFIIGFRREYRI